MRLAKAWLTLTLNLLLLFGCTQSQKPAEQDIRLEPPVFTIDVTSLWTEYQTNAAAADQIYKSKVILVSGPAYAGIVDGLVIQLGKSFPMVQCNLAAGEKSAFSADLRGGREVEIKGRIAGKVGNLVTLEGCYLQRLGKSH